MKLVLKNGTQIKLPNLNEIETAGDGKTSSIETSFLSEFKKRLTKNNEINNEERMRAYCLQKIQDVIRGKYLSYFEPLGGVGVTASIFSEDSFETYVNELDDACLEVIKNNFPTWTRYQQDMFKFEYSQNFDTIFLDFNNYTLAKYANTYYDVVHSALSHCNKYLIINDCSVFYLNRGAKSFEVYSKLLGEDVRDYKEYYPALFRFYADEFPGWRLERVETFYASSYLLFSKIEEPNTQEFLGQICSPVVTNHTSEEMKADPVLWLELPSKTKKLI